MLRRYFLKTLLSSSTALTATLAVALPASASSPSAPSAPSAPSDPDDTLEESSANDDGLEQVDPEDVLLLLAQFSS